MKVQSKAERAFFVPRDNRFNYRPHTEQLALQVLGCTNDLCSQLLVVGERTNQHVQDRDITLAYGYELKYSFPDITRTDAMAAYHPTRRAPSHWGAVNLVRSGTKQPQRSATGAEVKARLFRRRRKSEPPAHLKMQEGLGPSWNSPLTRTAFAFPFAPAVKQRKIQS